MEIWTKFRSGIICGKSGGAWSLHHNNCNTNIQSLNGTCFSNTDFLEAQYLSCRILGVLRNPANTSWYGESLHFCLGFHLWSLVGWIWEPSTILHSKMCFIIFPFPQKNWLRRTYKWLVQHPETTAWISSTTSPKKAGWNSKILQLTPRGSQGSSSKHHGFQFQELSNLGAFHQICCITGWWLNQPIWKIWVRMGIFPKRRQK